MKDENFHRNNNNCSGASSFTWPSFYVLNFLYLILYISFQVDDSPLHDCANFLNAGLLVSYLIFLVFFIVPFSIEKND